MRGLEFETEVRLASQVTGTPTLNPPSRRIAMSLRWWPPGDPIENILLQSCANSGRERPSEARDWNANSAKGKRATVRKEDASFPSETMYKKCRTKGFSG
ncbi:hypothetical protein DQ04_02371030 [Trypanosoma grayi]|uniref:hypothetical protein n=1 Tax=Trypanosoma grayi TaxID=71804 RepID=UPI0004F45278|nr:hypothetical protein DQ04_02371030 [Trypanosoma grayi]KEG11680.1 hypothetical protein DQ04_02371030 [Trypanosoma grayi]